MKIQEFVDKYNSFNNDTLKTNLCNEVMKNEYVPFTKKMSMCKSIAKITTHNNIKVGDKDKQYFNVDTANRYLLFRIKLLEEYTILEFSEDIPTQIKEYELLDQYGLNEILTDNIDEREYAQSKMILDMYVDDYIVNESNIVNYIDNKFEAVSLVFNQIVDILNEYLSNPEVLKVLSEVTPSDENKE